MQYEYIVICNTNICTDIKNIKSKKLYIETPQNKLEISYALGYSIYKSDNFDSIDDALKEADKNMYEDKKLTKINLNKDK